MRFFVRHVFPILVIVSTLLALQACAPKAEEDCGFVQNSYGQRISWKGRVPVHFYIDKNFPEKFVPSLQSAMDVWEKSAGRSLFKIVGRIDANDTKQALDGKNVVYWNDSWESDRSFEQARTSVYWEGDEIREADIYINAHDYSFFVDTPQSSKEVHAESLFGHELGHAIGLKHRESGGSVMASRLPSITVRDQLAESDKTALKCEY